MENSIENKFQILTKIQSWYLKADNVRLTEHK